MDYSQAIRFLYDLRLFGTKLGLENTLRLAGLVGNPHHRLRFIHVAGTNGKGSVCAMLEAIYRSAGLRVGLFTSPHLVRFNERIQVERVPVANPTIARLTTEISNRLGEFPKGQHPTFFEVVVVMALLYFAEQNCDLVVWETGMGGRLDATNIVDPLAAVITNIGRDHERWLGHSSEEIAREKAGIIKAHRPVIAGACDEAALQVIRRKAREMQSPMSLVTDFTGDMPGLETLPLVGEHQRRNAALAVTTAKVLRDRIPVSDAALCESLEGVRWPGRFQVIRRPRQVMVLDGAHNEIGAQALRRTVEQEFPHRALTLILGALQDKNWRVVLKSLVSVSQRVILVPVDSSRSTDPVALLEAVNEFDPNLKALACKNLEEALEQTAADPLILITGSLYLVGEALARLADSNDPPEPERALNEWQGVPDPKRPCEVR